jgi:hypothetical protein
MKIVALVLLFVISVNSFLCYLYLHVSMIQVKSEAGELISQLEDYDQPGLIKIPSYSLEKDESDEVWYQGKLYDVAKREMIRDTEYVYILHDQDEEDLLQDMSSYFTMDGNQVSLHPAMISGYRNIRAFVNQQYVTGNSKTSSIYKVFHKRLSLAKAYELPAFSSEVITPPPKFLFNSWN